MDMLQGVLLLGACPSRTGGRAWTPAAPSERGILSNRYARPHGGRSCHPGRPPTKKVLCSPRGQVYKNKKSRSLREDSESRHKRTEIRKAEVSERTQNLLEEDGPDHVRLRRDPGVGVEVRKRPRLSWGSAWCGPSKRVAPSLEAGVAQIVCSPPGGRRGADHTREP